MTVAFVLSGAANFGSLQVGALQVLLERGIRPDLLIGTSAGSMNAAYLALDPTPEGAHRLAGLWRSAARDVLSRSQPLSMLWRLMTWHDGLADNLPLRRFIKRSMPPGIIRYSDLRLPAYAVAVRLDTGEVRCFGDDPSDRILDGLMASTAIPGFYPPWMCDGIPYVDGGVVAYLPIRLAVERGATEVYAFNVDNARALRGSLRGTLAIATRALDLLIQRQGAHEIELHRTLPNVTVHPISLRLQRDVSFWDFGHADEMVAEGRAIAEAYLGEQPTTPPRAPTWREWLADRQSKWRARLQMMRARRRVAVP